MEPPICSLCDRDHRDQPDLDFDLVRFTDYEPIDHPGHPKGLHWFCSDHLEAAKTLEYLYSGEALERLRRQFGE
ncbi:hypothetical protein N9406_03785 [Verrucomicrobiales bacterium]|jgi:hypothetical protein|nr:hypothetical protein [Verrucomicrobiales bacterium]